MLPKLDRICAVLFDLDGTLIDSMWIWKEIDVEYLGSYGIPLPDDLQESIEGMSFTETACYFKDRFALPLTVEQIKSDWNRMAYEKYISQVPLKPGALSFIRKCFERGLKLGIATSNSRELAAGVSGALGIRGYFHCILTACDVTKGKPAPDVYLTAAGMLGVKPEHCLVFEDILPGIEAGKAAGMAVCAVADDYSRYQEQEKRRRADYYIEDYTQIAF